MKYNTTEAFDYYQRFIINEDKFKIFKDYNISVPGSVSNFDWECFAAIIINSKGRIRWGGADLVDAEVKSAVIKNGFCYHYYRDSGERRIEDDKQIKHVFISYSPDYTNVIVRIANGKQLAHIFESWKEKMIESYAKLQKGDIQFRKNISYKQNLEYGKLIMKIEDKKLTNNTLKELI